MNRDEALSRPAVNAEFHNFESSPAQKVQPGQVLSGRDALFGGTWFGVNRDGRVALLYAVCLLTNSDVN